MKGSETSVVQETKWRGEVVLEEQNQGRVEVRYQETI